MRYLIALFIFALSTNHALSASPKETAARYFINVKGALIKSCGDQTECTEKVMSFLWFVWDNRDRKDIHKQLGVCAATAAYKRGYVRSPNKLIADMTPDLAKKISVELCECVNNKWRNPSDVCHVLTNKLTAPDEIITAEFDIDEETDTDEVLLNGNQQTAP